MDDELIAAHRDVPALMPFLHLPVQSGSDRILEAMNRGHSADDYRRIVERLRAARPDIALSSDFIVGFPGESDARFRGDAARWCARSASPRPSRSNTAARPGTPGARACRDQVPDAVKAERLARCRRCSTTQQRALQRRAWSGRVLPVLFEKPGRHPGQLVGRSPYLQAVHAPAPARLIGAHRRRCASSRADANSLAGEVLSEAAA